MGREGSSSYLAKSPGSPVQTRKSYRYLYSAPRVCSLAEHEQLGLMIRIDLSAKI